MNDFAAPPPKPTLRGMIKTLHGTRAEPHFAAIRAEFGAAVGSPWHQLWVEPTFRLVPAAERGAILQVPLPYIADWYLHPSRWTDLERAALQVVGRHLAIAVQVTVDGFRPPVCGLLHDHWRQIRDAYHAATDQGWHLDDERQTFQVQGKLVRLFCSPIMQIKISEQKAALQEAVKTVFGPEAEAEVVRGMLPPPEGPKSLLYFDPHVARRVKENGGTYAGHQGAAAVDAATRDALGANTDQAVERIIAEKNRRFAVTSYQFLKDIPKLLDHERGELAVKIILRAAVEAETSSGKARFDVGNLARDYKTDPSHIRKAVKLIENYRLARVERGYGGFDLVFHPLDIFKQPAANLATEVSRFERESQEKGLPSAKRA